MSGKKLRIEEGAQCSSSEFELTPDLAKDHCTEISDIVANKIVVGNFAMMFLISSCEISASEE